MSTGFLPFQNSSNISMCTLLIGEVVVKVATRNLKPTEISAQLAGTGLGSTHHSARADQCQKLFFDPSRFRNSKAPALFVLGSESSPFYREAQGSRSARPGCRSGRRPPGVAVAVALGERGRPPAGLIDGRLAGLGRRCRRRSPSRGDPLPANRRLLDHLAREREHLFTLLRVAGAQAGQLARRADHPPRGRDRQGLGGNRSRDGAATWQTLASVLRTARHQPARPRPG